MRKSDGLWKVVILLLLFGVTPRLKAQDNELRPVSSTYAIKNVTIVQAPGRTIEGGTVLMENGVIKAVGANVSVPADAWIVEADSMYVYAGFISGMSNIGVEKPKDQESNDDKKLTGTPTYQRAGITPNVNVRELLSPKEKSVDEFRKLGFTASHSVPYGGMITGSGAMVLLGGTSGESMLVKEQTALFSQWQGASGVYPNTVIGIMAKYRDMYRKASQARDYASKYNSSNSGMERPDADKMLEAMFPVVAKQRPVAFKTESILDIHRALTLKNDLGFNLMIGEVKQGWDAVSAIKNAGISAFLSLDLPEMEEEKKKEAKKEEKDEGSDEDEKQEPTAEEKERAALEKRKKEMVKNYYTQASAFNRQGIKFGFSTLDSKSKDFKSTLVKIQENGLSEDQTLAALTTTPAQILGVSNLMGTVDAGKMANLVVTDKPYFEKESNVRYVFVDGVKYDYDIKKKKKKSSGEATVEVVGKWSYSVETPQGNGSGIITINGDDGDYSGDITVSFNGSTNDLRDITVDGSTLAFSFTINMGEESTVDISMDIDEDTFEGTLSVQDFGSFPMEGSKEPEY